MAIRPKLDLLENKSYNKLYNILTCWDATNLL